MKYYQKKIFTSQVYISEISTAELRGVLGALGSLGISGGIVIVYALGAVLPWRQVALVCAGASALCAGAFVVFCPESPGWLYLHGDLAAVEKALRKLRGQK